MSILKAIFGYDKNGGPRVYMHFIRHERFVGAWYLYFFRQTYHLEWHLFARHCGLRLSFADFAISDHAVQLHFGIPFVLSVWLQDKSAKWPRRLPGVRWDSSNANFDSGSREFSISFHHASLWWMIWAHCDKHRDTWRNSSFNFSRLIFGDFDFEETVLNESPLEDWDIESVILPEGRYHASCKHIRRVWRWPRWYRAVEDTFFKIEVERGVPIPGKGENSWDQGDDAIYAITLSADDIKTRYGALSAFADRVLSARCKYANLDWQPHAGWPAHCDQSMYDPGRVPMQSSTTGSN